MITVYHNILFLKMSFKQPDKIDRSFLVKVATVDSDDVDVAFRDTNHIDEDWTRNRGVTPHVSSPRSTSVGDVMEIDGKFLMVATCGFKEVEVISESRESLADLVEIFGDDFDKYFTITTTYVIKDPENFRELPEEIIKKMLEYYIKNKNK